MLLIDLEQFYFGCELLWNIFIVISKVDESITFDDWSRSKFIFLRSKWAIGVILCHSWSITMSIFPHQRFLCKKGVFLLNHNLGWWNRQIWSLVNFEGTWILDQGMALATVVKKLSSGWFCCTFYSSLLFIYAKSKGTSEVVSRATTMSTFTHLHIYLGFAAIKIKGRNTRRISYSPGGLNSRSLLPLKL